MSLKSARYEFRLVGLDSSTLNVGGPGSFSTVCDYDTGMRERLASALYDAETDIILLKKALKLIHDRADMSDTAIQLDKEALGED
jgi:hypothetical protein